MPEEYYVITKNDTGEYLKELDENDDPVFTTEHNEAGWSFDPEVLNRFIDDFDLAGVKAVPGTGGNHPPRPPLSA